MIQLNRIYNEDCFPFIDNWCNGMVRDIYDRMSDITNKKRNE